LWLRRSPDVLRSPAKVLQAALLQAAEVLQGTLPQGTLLPSPQSLLQQWLQQLCEGCPELRRPHLCCSDLRRPDLRRHGPDLRSQGS
jgi:hypothetical protein